MLRTASLSALPGLPEIEPGANLAALICTAASASHIDINASTVVVVAQKAVSKAEGRYVDLNAVTPSAAALELAERTSKDARLVELILSESSTVLRAIPGVLIVRHRLGHVMANAGIDRSNLPAGAGQERVLLLPIDPDHSAAQLRTALSARLGVAPGVIISDSFGRPWRNGVVNVALGAAGLPSLVDRRGELDRHGRTLEVTQLALADAVSAAAGLVMGEGAEGTPVVVVSGINIFAGAPQRAASALIRPLEEDLFQ